MKNDKKISIKVEKINNSNFQNHPYSYRVLEMINVVVLEASYYGLEKDVRKGDTFSETEVRKLADNSRVTVKVV